MANNNDLMERNRDPRKQAVRELKRQNKILDRIAGALETLAGRK